MRLARLAAAVVLLVAIAVLSGWIALDRWLSEPLPIGAETARVEVPRGTPLSRIAQTLADRGLLDHPRLLALYARWTGADARIRAGEYDIPPGTTPRSLLDLLESGAVVQHSVTLVEGWTFRDVRRALAQVVELRSTLAGVDDQAVMRRLGEPDLSPEGLFFPDTYLFDKGSTDLDVLRRARDAMRAALDRAWAGRAPDLPFDTPYQALILASIVEKETALPSERARIAGVFVERLRAGMRLQTDPTVIYGLGPKFDGNLRRSDLERDGPYNTYTRAGLPPTPIAMPGVGSLTAAAHPDEQGEFYFVATGEPDGSHRFSKTLSEHERAVADYLRRYRRRKAEQ